MSDGPSSAHSSSSANKGRITLPQRPPRRVSHAYSDVGSLEEGESSHLSSSSVIDRDEGGKIASSRIERLVKESNGRDNDIDRTPTRNARTAEMLAERASRTALRRDFLKQMDENETRQHLRKSQGGSNSTDVDKAYPSGPGLRHYASTATIRSSERNYGNGSRASSSIFRTKLEEQLSPRSERLKRSQKYEEDIQRMRSESRLGGAKVEDDERQRRSLSRSSQKATDTTDTSGTEGSGPVIGNRRRKKSSTGSSSKKAAARAAHSRDFYTSPSKKYSSPYRDRVPSSSDGPSSSSNGPYATLTSPLRTESAIDFTSPSRSTSSRRLPLPTDFQSPRYRAKALLDASLDRERQRSNSIDAAAEQRLRSREEISSNLTSTGCREQRLNRMTSLSPGSDTAIEVLTSPIIPPLTQREDGRLERADLGSNSRHSNRASKYGVLTERNEVNPNRSESGNRSISDLLRQRKISTSSSVSLRSSSGTSELHRASSRSSLRRSHGKDVFDDGTAPPLPDSSNHPLSPLFRATEVAQEQQKQAMSQALRDKQDTIKGDYWMREVEELQSRIDQLTAAAAGDSSTVSHRDAYSRSSSRASASAPRSSTSNVSSTPSAALSRRANKPSTEPRNARNGNDYSRNVLPPPNPLPSQRYDSISRASVREVDRRLPVTPNMTDLRVISGSRMGSGTQSSAGRFSSFGGNTSRSLSASIGSGPLHERNLLNSVDGFERYILDSRRASIESSLIASPSLNESDELVNKFKETSHATININTGLRQLLQCILEIQIDVEVEGRERFNAAVLNDIDKSLTSILRHSDEQMRNLTDGLLAFTRIEKERDRLRRTTGDLNRSTNTLPRSSSRLASLGMLQMSPDRERRFGRETSQALYSERRTSTDLRKSITARERDRDRAKIVASHSNSSIQAVESQSQTSDRSSGSRNSAESNPHQQRRHTLVHDSRDTSSIGSSSKSPSIPYSPSPNPSAVISGTGIQPRIRGSNTSPTLDMHLNNRRITSIDRENISHSRSTSEVQLKTHANYVTGLESLIQRSPLLRRDKTSTTSVQTVRAPLSLSPKRAQLSFPIVSAMTVEGSTVIDPVSDNHEEGFRNSPTIISSETADVSPEGSVD